MLTKEQKIKKVESLDAEQLLGAFQYYEKNFNPIDDDCCESYSIIRAEIIKRLTK